MRLHSARSASHSVFKGSRVGARAQSRPNQENGPNSPDPFPSQRVGSGDETSCDLCRGDSELCTGKNLGGADARLPRPCNLRTPQKR